jgi:hypothetical protein
VYLVACCLSAITPLTHIVANAIICLLVASRWPKFKAKWAAVTAAGFAGLGAYQRPLY